MAYTLKTREEGIYHKPRSEYRDGTISYLNGSECKHNRSNPVNLDIHDIKDREMMDFKKSARPIFEQSSKNQETLVTVHEGEAPLPRSRFNNTLIQGMNMNKIKTK